MSSSARPRLVPIPGAASDWTGVVGSIGPKVFALRRARGLTLQQLAHVADVSTAAVHKVERGEMVPTITTLLKIAGALDVPIRHFVEDADPAPSAVHTRFSDALDGGQVPITGDTFRTMGTACRMAPGEERHGRSLPGETLLVVLAGRLVVDVGEERYAVGGGESLHFRTDLEHRCVNTGDVAAEVVRVTVPER